MINKKILVVGHGGSGKDFLVHKLINRGFKKCISHTTRPKRKNESDKKDYYFISEKKFKENISNNSFIEYQVFNTWYYGISKKEFDECDVLIVTPHFIKQLSKKYRDNCFIIYIDIDENIRRNRLNKRNDSDSTDRRIFEDKKLFDNFCDYDLKIKNTDF